MFKIALPFQLLLFLAFFSLPTYAQTPQAVAYYQKAFDLFEQDKPNEALLELNKAIVESPLYEEAILLRARYFADIDEQQKAMQDLSLLVRLAPQSVPYLLERGTYLQNIQQFDEAETDFLTALEKDTINPEVLNALASLYHTAELPQDALVYLQKILKLNPKDYQAHYTRAWVYQETKQYDLALADAKFCKEAKKDDYNVLRLEAICYIKKEKYDEALKVFEIFREKKIKLYEEDFLYWGIAYYGKKDYKNALFYLSLPEKPSFTDLYYFLGKTYFQLNDHKNALQKLDSAIILLKKLDESGSETELASPVYYDRAIVRQKAGKTKEASADLLQACYLTPEIVAQKDYEGNVIPLLGDAIALLKPKKATIDSVRLKGYQDRAESFALTGETNRAWAEIQKCDQIDSLQARNAVLRAKVALILGKNKDALTYLDKAERSPKGKADEEIAYFRALAYQELGEFVKAKEHIEKAIKINQYEASYYSTWANIEYDAANPKKALEAIEKALKMQPQNLNFVIEHAIYAQADGKYEDAIKDCNKVIEQESDNAEAYYQRGLAYRATKRYKEALTDFQKAEQYFHDEPELKELIREMKGK